jgi:hypothetical protein
MATSKAKSKKVAKPAADNDDPMETVIVVKRKGKQARGEEIEDVEPAAKKPGKGKAKEVISIDADDEDEMQFDETSAYEQEKIIRGALISINLIDMAATPIPYRHGLYNNRGLSDKALKKLNDIFKSQGVQRFDLDNALPLILRREHLHPDAVNNTLSDPENAPMLKLTEAGMKEEFLNMAGGRHRWEVVMRQWAAKQKTLTTLEAKLEKKKASLDAKTGKSSQTILRSLHDEVLALDEQIRVLKRSTLWVVKVYDAGM